MQVAADGEVAVGGGDWRWWFAVVMIAECSLLSPACHIHCLQGRMAGCTAKHRQVSVPADCLIGTCGMYTS